MGNLPTGGFGFTRNPDGFQSFQGTGAEVHVLIVACSYNYAKGGKLSGVKDGEAFSKLCDIAGAKDVVLMRDDLRATDPLFPTSVNVRNTIAEIGRRCQAQDYFLFYFSGHGARVVDMSGSGPFADALVLPGRNYDMTEEQFLVDDDLALALDSQIPNNTKILALTDCCHSAALVDVGAFGFKHQICSISACQEDEKSVDTGSHGILTLAVRNAVTELSLKKGNMEYSIQSIFNKAVKHARRISKKQTLAMHTVNLDPKLSAWPLPQPWWRHIPGFLGWCSWARLFPWTCRRRWRSTAASSARTAEPSPGTDASDEVVDRL